MKMKFRKQKPDMSGHFFALTIMYEGPVIVRYIHVSDAVKMIGESLIIVDFITHWGDRIETPSVEIEEDDA